MSSRFRLVLIVGLVLLISSVYGPVLGKELVNMEFKQAPLVDVFQILGQLGGYNVLVDPSVTGDVTFALKNLPVEEALDLVTRTTGYRYKLMGNTLIIGSDQRLKTEFGTQDFTFVLVENVDVEAAQRLVTMMVPNIKSYVDKEQSLLILFGLTTDLELAKQVIGQYDKKAFAPVVTAEPVAVQQVELESYAMTVFYADGGSILDLVRQEWPLVEFSWDEQSKNIVAKASKGEWPAIQKFIQEVDLPKFVLKGLLGKGEETLALVEFKGSTNLVKQGETLEGWRVLAISTGGVEFSQGQRTFVVKMGR